MTANIEATRTTTIVLTTLRCNICRCGLFIAGRNIILGFLSCGRRLFGRLYCAPMPVLTDRKNSCKPERKGARILERKKTKKGTPPPRYDEAFKTGAVRLVTEQGHQPTEASKELGICIDTLCSWLKASGIKWGR